MKYLLIFFGLGIIEGICLMIAGFYFLNPSYYDAFRWVSYGLFGIYTILSILCFYTFRKKIFRKRILKKRILKKRKSKK